MGRFIVALIFLIPFSLLNADITNLVALKKDSALKGPEKIVFIGVKHAFRHEIPDANKQEPLAQKALKETELLLKSFDKNCLQDSACAFIEAHYPYYDKTAELTAADKYCSCLLNKSDKNECKNAALIIKKQFLANDDTNTLEVLAESLQGDNRALFPDDRAIIVNLATLFDLQNMSNYLFLSERDLAACKRTGVRHGLTVEKVFSTVLAAIDGWIETARGCLTLFENKENVRITDAFISSMEDYKAAWIDLQRYLGFDPKADFTTTYMTFVLSIYRDFDVATITLLDGLIKKLNREFRDTLLIIDLAFIKGLLKSDGAFYYVLAGYAHTSNIVNMLMREGYTISYDSGLECGYDQKVPAVTQITKECVIKGLPLKATKKALEETQPSQDRERLRDDTSTIII